MENITKGFLLGAFVGVVLMLVAMWIENPSAKVYDDQPVILEQIRADNEGWEYQFYTGSYYRLTVVSEEPLGYSKGDTVQFAGNDHPCEPVARREDGAFQSVTQ